MSNKAKFIIYTHVILLAVILFFQLQLGKVYFIIDSSYAIDNYGTFGDLTGLLWIPMEVRMSMSEYYTNSFYWLLASIPLILSTFLIDKIDRLYSIQKKIAVIGSHVIIFLLVFPIRFTDSADIDYLIPEYASDYKTLPVLSKEYSLFNIESVYITPILNDDYTILPGNILIVIGIFLLLCATVYFAGIVKKATK